jgi:hypothetical protein
MDKRVPGKAYRDAASLEDTVEFTAEELREYERHWAAVALDINALWRHITEVVSKEDK